MIGVDIKLESGECLLGYEDLVLVEGEDSLIQDIRTKLLTDLGVLFYDQNFGSGMLRYLHAPNDELTRLEIKTVLKSALKTEPRIDPNSIFVNVDKKSVDEIIVNVEFIIIDANDKKNLVLNFGEELIIYEVLQ